MATILIVDDEPVILDVLSRFLESDTRTLIRAGSAGQALDEAARGGPVDVALVDKNLGDGSGLDLARELRRRQPDVEIILVTGYASIDSAIEAVQIGAFDYVTKPVADYDALNLKVERAVEKVRMKRDQRALMERLQESEERYRGLFEASSDGVLLYDPATGAVQEANPAATRLYGRSLEELRARRVGDLLAPGSSEADLAPAHASAPARHLRKDGAAFPVEVTTGEVAVQGRALRVLSIRDVSERERAEVERRKLEEGLRQAQKMEAVGRLAGGVAHDFSNILAVILGYSDLLLRDVPQADSRARESVQGIVEAANRAVGVTRQLLTVSRKKLVRPEILSVNKVVADLTKLLGRAVGERIALTTALAPELWPVEADLDQLAQVLLNLAVNARDAMPNGGPLAITTRNVVLEQPLPAGDAELAPGRWVAITVSDRGVGMSEEVRARIFEPFFTTKETGTGLGLATVYGIVRQAGGGVEVESKVGEGTRFTVYLPAAEARAQAAGAPVEAVLARGLGETVLLAEDEDALRMLIRRVLSGQGYRVIDAKDGRDALDAARGYGGPIHLLLADLVMPRMSGQQLADALAAVRPDVKVLFMTGHTEEGVLPSKVAQGQAVLLQKPFTGEALLGTVRRLLEASAAAVPQA